MRIVHRWGVRHRRGASTALTLTTRLRAAPLSHDMFTPDHKLLCVCVFFCSYVRVYVLSSWALSVRAWPAPPAHSCSLDPEAQLRACENPLSLPHFSRWVPHCNRLNRSALIFLLSSGLFTLINLSNSYILYHCWCCSQPKLVHHFRFLINLLKWSPFQTSLNFADIFVNQKRLGGLGFRHCFPTLNFSNRYIP